MQDARTVFDTLNTEYLIVHKTKEDLFWDTYMAVSNDDAGRGILLRALAVLEPATATDFATLANGVLERAAACSACVHVVLDWDEPRAALVRGLHALGIAQIVLVAGDIPGAQTAEGVPLHRLDPDDLAGSLAAMPVQCR